MHRSRHRARRHPRALLIDAMGTLVALRPPAPLLRSLLAQRFGVVVSEADAEIALRAEIRFYRARMHGARDPESLAALRLRCAAVLLQALPPVGVREPAALVATLLDSLRFVAHEDARAALLAVRERGARTVVVSNWDVSLPEVLERTGLAPLLDGAVSSAVAGAAKPDPAIFALGLSLAGARARDAVHVGDSPSEDVAGARAAGIDAILIDRPGADAPVPGVRTIRGLDELGWPFVS